MSVDEIKSVWTHAYPPPLDPQAEPTEAELREIREQIAAVRATIAVGSSTEARKDSSNE